MDTLVLISGGLDSAVLLAHEATTRRAHPVYVSVGLAWEAAERAMLTRLLASPGFDSVAPLENLEFGMRDVYAPDHWAIRGTPPPYDTADEEVYLSGRNLVLLTKAGVLAAARGISRIALGPLAGNPFPDATPEFFTAMGSALSLGLSHRVEIATPFAALHKEDVIKMGAALGVPFELTLSCMSPLYAGLKSRATLRAMSRAANDDVDSVTPDIARDFSPAIPVHCGLCSKCRERRDAFAAAGIDDPTTYANQSPR